MRDYIHDLIEKYAIRGILIDSNILLLLFVGSYDPSMIGSFKRTRSFTPEDYDLLCRLLTRFRKIYTTPNILTEVSNLAGYMNEPLKAPFFETFRLKIVDLSEEFFPSSSASIANEFIRFGLTDTVITRVANSNNLLVLTDDLRLANYLSSIKIDAINFNNIRISALL